MADSASVRGTLRRTFGYGDPTKYYGPGVNIEIPAGLAFLAHDVTRGDTKSAAPVTPAPAPVAPVPAPFVPAPVAPAAPIVPAPEPPDMHSLPPDFPARNALAAVGIKTFEQVTALSNAQLDRIDGVTTRMVRTIRQAAASHSAR